MAQSISSTIRILVDLSVLTTAIYLATATALGHEGNFLLFVWCAFAPTVTVALGFFVALWWLMQKRRRRAPARLRVTTLGALLVAALIPIARELQYLRADSVSPPQRHSFTLFDMNLLGHRDITQFVLPEIRSRNPDIVLLQEVTPEIAAKLQSELGDEYPCQITDPRPGSYGMATLVRHPCERLPFESTGYWVGRPQITKVTLPNNNPLLAVNLHGIHPHALIDVEGDEGIAGELNNTVHARESAIKELLNYLEPLHNTPSVMAGDLNATMRNRVYSLIRNGGYRDAWLDTHSLSDIAFRGGTWPFPEYGIPTLLAWILRIDFVFYSKELTPKRVEILPPNLGSDHRGLLVTFGE
jgi:endonuclease/exonuclease/phosphatase (EEP) superfamily protein YafD